MPVRIPEQLFVVINRIVGFILRSPLHRLMSGSFTVIRYTGRKSGRPLATPVRYMEIDGGFRCFTSDHVQWWRNVAAIPEVTLLIKGETLPCKAVVLAQDPELSRRHLIEFLALYPQDATYQDIRLNTDGTLNEADLGIAAGKSVVVEFLKKNS